MNGLLIAIFLGWLGGYRFYKKQTALGVIYLLTGGLFGIGWIIDIITAAKNMNCTSPHSISMQIEIKGAFAGCKKNPNIMRRTIIESLPIGSPLGIETAYYEGAPFFQLLAPNGLDIGSFPAEVSREIKSKYPNATISAILTNKTDLEQPYAKITINP